MARKKANKKLPSFDELLIPTVKALKELRGSGSVDEINTKVYEIADISVLVITTGTFTREAIKEATRDGAPPIDLIDGELLCNKLKELNLGLITELTETVQIKNDWFSNL